MNISEEIKRIRESKGLSQMDVAVEAGVEQYVVSRVERSSQKITFAMAERLLNAMGEELVIQPSMEGKIIEQAAHGLRSRWR